MQTTNKYKVHIDYQGDHNGWLDDMLDLIKRIYNMDAPYCYNKVSIAIEIDSETDTGYLSATLHYPSSSELEREVLDE